MTNTIDTFNIQVGGAAVDFGDLSVARGEDVPGTSDSHGGLDFNLIQRPSVTYMPGSGRGFTNAGTTTGGSANSINTIEMIFVPTLGKALDFGDLTVARQLPASTNSITRSCVAGETSSAQTNTIDSLKCSLLVMQQILEI